MDADWITSPSARRVHQHAGDPRPAWLWSQDGRELIWHNDAAELFLAKLKRHGLKRAAMAQPIKGQVARNIRLGSPGRTSLARIQFLAGDKPASSTCATTPLSWQDGETVLLIVGVDAIDSAILDASRAEQVSPDADQAGTADVKAPQDEAVLPKPDDAPATEEATEEAPAAPEPAGHDDLAAYERELKNWRAAEIDENPRPTLVVADERAEEPAETTDVSSRLSRLVDRLAADEALYAPLTEADDVPPPADPGTEPETEATVNATPADENPGEPLPEPATETATAPPDAEVVERVSRYNFDELSRILTDRVGEAGPAPRPVETPPPPPEPVRTGSLVNLGGETLVLNRLPLGILVFRDQQILFANRAITEMVGYESVESLRNAGLGSVFPAAGPEQEAGPVNHLVQRDGTMVPVTARLQSISWQGRPALMLSASTTEVRTGHEGAVRAFARTMAETGGDGYFDTTRTGVISAITPEAMELLGADNAAEGKPLSRVIAEADVPALRDFLERPARFAETERPTFTARSASGRGTIVLFAQGQAGVVTGYFGIVRAKTAAPPRLSGPGEPDPALLARISRGVRRPLNTIVGFSDLIRSKAFGPIENERYEAYAQDIATAGQEISALVDELDDYARLRDGRYLPDRASIELSILLESCVVRIRGQAGAARVIVRSAISERLPRITADRASLAQAVLNLLASAIDQTPVGGAVVISAQPEDDGSIAVQVRDSSTSAVDMAERFVVFRDGVGRDGQVMTPVRSSVGLALTRSLLAVNAFSLSVNPAGSQGMLFTLIIPADMVEKASTPRAPE